MATNRTRKDTNEPKVTGGFPAPKVEVIDSTAVVPGDAFETATRRVNSDVGAKDIARKQLTAIYKAEPLKSVMIAPTYAAYFGRVMLVSINGHQCAVPCDGRPHNIPETFAAEVQQRLRSVNDQMSKRQKLGNITGNVETSPGELRLI